MHLGDWKKHEVPPSNCEEEIYLWLIHLKEIRLPLLTKEVACESSRSDSVCQDISVLTMLLATSQTFLAAIQDWYISDLGHIHHLGKKKK